MVDSSSVTITATAPLVPTTITISASASTVNTGGQVTISGAMKDQNGNGISGIPVYLFESSGPAGGFSQAATQDTVAGGSYSFVVNFPVAGQFTFDVSSDTSNA